MKTLRTALIWSVATAAIFAFPPIAGGAYLIPPGNSAVNQYTEAYPTSRGQSDSERGVRAGNRSPTSVLGKLNSRRLTTRGEAGRAAAAVAAMTAPGSIPASLPTKDADPIHQRAKDSEDSGLDAVVAEASGFSGSGGMGVLLPLIIVCAFIWSIAFLWRRRKRPAA